jgi:hypothetical protein
MNFRLVLIVIALAAPVPTALASTSCVSTGSGPRCTSQVNFNQFVQRAYQTQQASQWCWAASISMLFAFNSHSVAQPRIVQEAYGSVVNMPAVGSVMAQTLNRAWTDDNGRTFYSTLEGAFDPAAGINTLNNAQLISELDQNRPYVIGTNGHAMVVTSMTYYQTSYGPYVVDVSVFDPWPTNGGARSLSASDFTPITQGGGMTFIAIAQVSEVTPAAAANPFGNSGSGGGAMDWYFTAMLVVVALLAKAMQQRQRIGFRRQLPTGESTDA